jgi:hypothetical protein
MSNQEEFNAASSTLSSSRNAGSSAPSSKRKSKKYPVAKKLKIVGSEDDLIHCFKPEGSIPSGRDFLRNARVDAEAQALAEVLDEIDLEEDSNNDYIDDDPLKFVE